MSPLIPVVQTPPPKWDAALVWHLVNASDAKVPVGQEFIRALPDAVRALLEGTTTCANISLGLEAPSLSKLLNRTKERGGLTWAQVARLMGVSPRAIHKWRRGGSVNALNAESVAKLSELISAADSGNPFATRTRLLDRESGMSAFELFAAGESDAAVEVACGARVVERPSALHRVARRELSPAAKAAREARQRPNFADLINTDYSAVPNDDQLDERAPILSAKADDE